MKRNDRPVNVRSPRIKYTFTLGAKLFIGGIYFSLLFLVVLIIYIMRNPY